MKRIPVVPDQTADGLLSGAMEPDDAPPGYSDVATLLRAAAAPFGARARRASDGMAAAQAREERFPGREERFPHADSAKEQRQIAAIVLAISAPSGSAQRPDPKRARHRFLPNRVRLGALVAAGMLFGGTGLAFAGALPTPAQSLASTLLSKVGISVPHGQSKSSTTASGQTTTPTASPAPIPSKGPDPNGPAKSGLCTAFFSGQGGTNGGKNAAVPFQNLQQAAQAAGQSVEEFCKTPTAKGNPQGKHPGNGSHHESRGQHGAPQGHGGSAPGPRNGEHQPRSPESGAGQGPREAKSMSHDSKARS